MICVTGLVILLSIFVLLLIRNTISVTRTKPTTRPPPTKNPLDEIDFSLLVETLGFVDKSMLIREFMDGPPRILITAPHEFGKSSNLDMVRRFLSFPNSTFVNETGSDEKTNETLSLDCKIFQRHNLKIYEDKAFFYKHCGKYPVIYLDFVDMLVYDFTEHMNSLIYSVYVAFRHHDYMVREIGYDKYGWTNDRMEEHDIDRFLRFWDVKRFSLITEIDLKKSLFTLSHMLHSYHDHKVTVLVDEFDAMWLKVINQNDSKPKMCTDLYHRMIFILLSSNHHLDRVMLMSCTKYGPQLSLNKITSIKMFEFGHDHRYSKYFGFTTDEVKDLLTGSGAPDRLEDVRHWYNGYNVTNQSLSLYQPWSIVHYLNSMTLKPYGTSFSYIHNMRQICMSHEVRDRLMKLLHGTPVYVKLLKKNPDLTTITDFKNILAYPKAIWRLKEHWNDFLLYLYECRFLVPFEAVPNSSQEKLGLVLPNNEAIQILFQYMYSRAYYEKHFKFKRNRMYEFLDAFNELGKDNMTTFTNFTNSIARLFTFTRLPEDTYAFGFSIYYLFKLPRVYPVVNLELSEMIGINRTVQMTVIRDDGTAVIMEPTYGTVASAAFALRHILKTGYYEILNRRPDMWIKATGPKIYMGIFLEEAKIVEVCYLVNSIDFSKRRCVVDGMNMGVPIGIVAQIKAFMNKYVANKLKNTTSYFLPRDPRKMYLSKPNLKAIEYNSTNLSSTL